MSAGTLGSTSTSVYALGGGTPNEIGTSTTDVLGFYGVSAIAQRANAAQTTLVLSWTASGNGFGFTTSDEIVNLIATVQEIQATLKLLGLWKGSA